MSFLHPSRVPFGVTPILASAAGVVLLASSALAGGPAYGVPSGVMPWEQPLPRNLPTIRRPEAPPAPRAARYAVTISVGSGRVPAGRSSAIPAEALPWNQPGFRGYAEIRSPVRLPPGLPDATPVKYVLHAVPLTSRVQGEDSKRVVLMTRLPAEARLWVQGRPTTGKGDVRFLKSPPLPPGRTYRYTARVVWPEDGLWVGQTLTFPVQAGQIHAVYLSKAGPTVRLSAK